MTPRYIPPNLRLEPGEAEARKQLDVERRGGTAALAAAHDRYGELPREPRENRRQSSLTEFRSHEGLGYSTLPPHEDEAWWRYALAFGPTPANTLDTPERRALSRASGAAGNYLVPTDLEDQIIEAARTESAISRLARTITTDGGSTLQVPLSTTHGAASWVAENASVSPTDEVFDQITLGAFKVSTKVIVSEELAKDARVPFDAYLAQEVGARLGVTEGAAFATGSGTGQPMGITTAAGGVSVIAGATGSATTFTLADITALYNGLPAAYRSRATFVLHPADYSALASRVDTAGSIAIPSLQAPEPSLFGKPVLVDPNMPTPAASARSAVFADFERAYTICRVAGISVQRLEELHADSGQLGYRARERVDGRVVLADAARVLSHSAT